MTRCSVNTIVAVWGDAEVHLEDLDKFQWMNILNHLLGQRLVLKHLIEQ